jgi:hypothetical protein
MSVNITQTNQSALSFPRRQTIASNGFCRVTNTDHAAFAGKLTSATDESISICALSKKAVRTHGGARFCGVTHVLADGGLYLAVHADGGWKEDVQPPAR